MKIVFERSGGIVGLRIVAEIDSDSLDADEAQELHDLVEQSDFFNLPATLRPDRRLADQFEYKISIVTDERKHTIEMGEGALSDDLRPLVRRLTVLARSAKT